MRSLLTGCAIAAALAAAVALPLPALAQAAPTLKVATWNLGWHLDRDAARDWIAACSAPFALDGATWKPAPAAGPGTQAGWTLPWGRNAPVEWDIGQRPPCDVFQANRAPLPVTEAAYAQRSARIGTVVRDQIQADVIAFQEVSGAAAIAELMGSAYAVCSYEGHKVQRLAIAWKKSLGTGTCSVEWPVSLPERALRDQVRPGLQLRLQMGSHSVTVMTVHLKSSCVSPLDERAAEGRGQLDGSEPNCVSLQQQVAPLEAWIDREASRSDALVLLGDFNRNLSHEASEPPDRPARSSGGSATEPHGPGVKVRSLWRELNDGQPALTLLDPQCTPDVDAAGLCRLGKTAALGREQMGALRSGEALGCRNPLGLDHIVLAGSARSPQGAFKHPMGRLGLTLAGSEGREAQLGLSDHCALAAVVELAR